jgi:hypothetical protein
MYPGWIYQETHTGQAAYPDAHKIRKLSVVNQSDHSLSHSADGYQSMGHKGLWLNLLALWSEYNQYFAQYR